VDVPFEQIKEEQDPRHEPVPVPVTRQVYVDVPQPFDQPFEQLVQSVRDVPVMQPMPMMQQPTGHWEWKPDNVQQPMPTMPMQQPMPTMPMPTMPMPMSTGFVGGNMFGAQTLGTTGFGTFGGI
jgi:hypothetical protein